MATSVLAAAMRELPKALQLRASLVTAQPPPPQWHRDDVAIKNKTPSTLFKIYRHLPTRQS
ncbi:MAG: hypothetical protein J5861_04255 [Desulfovibrio sp.]|nr:hypothetical protein [Desulfovibrio sp.]